MSAQGYTQSEFAQQLDLDAEETARIAADSTLTTAIAAEATTRASADTTLTTAVAAEATTRASAITTEAAARVAGDAASVSTAATDATTKANAAQAAAIQRANHTGTQSADTLTDGTTNKAFLATERTKLTGIATAATANSTDATLLARANHTGTQLAATISDFNTAVATTAVLQSLVDAKGDLYAGTADNTVARMAVGSTGTVLMAASEQTPGLAWVDLLEINGAYLSSGQETMSRYAALSQTAITLTSQTLRLAYFTARKTESINSIRVLTGTTAAGATPSLVKFAIFSVAGNGDITRQGITSSDTSIFSVATTAYERALGGAVSLTRGSRYAIAALVVTAAAAPTILGNTAANGVVAEAARAPRIAAAKTGQADIASSYLSTDLADTVNTIYAVAVP